MASIVQYLNEEVQFKHKKEPYLNTKRTRSSAQNPKSFLKVQIHPTAITSYSLHQVQTKGREIHAFICTEDYRAVFSASFKKKVVLLFLMPLCADGSW